MLDVGEREEERAYDELELEEVEEDGRGQELAEEGEDEA